MSKGVKLLQSIGYTPPPDLVSKGKRTLVMLLGYPGIELHKSLENSNTCQLHGHSLGLLTHITAWD